MKPNDSTNTSSASSWRSIFVPRLAWILAIGVACAVVFGVRSWMNSKYGAFCRTTSPDNFYSVVLKGDKRRPWIIPSTVSADVFKSGQPFQSNIWLHSADDSFDLSFEAGFPNIRWLGNNTVEFYRPEYFKKGADSLVVFNAAATPIKYLRVQSVNRFLLFEIPPGASVALEIPSPRGDSQDIALEGSFTNDKQILFNSKSFNRRSTQRKRFAYEISIDESGCFIANKEPSNGSSQF